jgi:hypothetical protein
VLVRTPQERVSAKDLVQLCRHKFAGYLSASALAGVAPEAELAQILRHAPRDRLVIRLMSPARKQQLVERLRHLQGVARGAGAGERN